MIVNPPPVVLGGVGLIKGNVQRSAQAMVAVANMLKSLAPPSWLADQPFAYVNLILRFGEASESVTEFQPLSRRHRELPLARTMSMRECQEADRAGRLVQLFMDETIRALRDVAAKYDLDSSWLDNEALRTVVGQTNVAEVPRCRYCDAPLRTAQANQCFECGMNWRDPTNVVQLGKASER